MRELKRPCSAIGRRLGPWNERGRCCIDMLRELLDHQTVSLMSFVVCSADDTRFARIEREIHSKIALVQCEIVRIADASSLAEGYNRGYARSRGEWVIFCHDDITFVNHDLTYRLLRSLPHCDVLGLCGTSRLVSGNWYDAGSPFISGAVVAPSMSDAGGYELQVFARRIPPLVADAQALDGIFIAARRRVVEALGGFNEHDFRDFVVYDIDFSFRAHLAGFRVGIATDILVFHDSHVARFSPEKLRRWNEAQAIFVSNYRCHLAPDIQAPSGLLVFDVPTREDALALYETLPAIATLAHATQG